VFALCGGVLGFFEEGVVMGIDTDEMKIRRDVLKKGILPAKGYKVDKRIIWAGFIPSLIIVGILFMQYGFGDHWSVSCPESRVKCFNNFYDGCNPLNVFENCAVPELREKVCADDPGLCKMNYLPGGFKAGSEPGWFFEWADILIWVFPLWAVLVNHLKYNRNWRQKK